MFLPQILTVALIILFSWVVIRIFGNPELSLLGKYEKEGLEKLEEIISSVGGLEKIRFFTNGHPYVWVESNYEDVKKLVLLSCQGLRGAPMPASFKAKINQDNGFVYIVRSSGTEFDWSSLQHYEEWLKSNEPFSERIASYSEEK